MNVTDLEIEAKQPVMHSRARSFHAERSEGGSAIFWDRPSPDTRKQQVAVEKLHPFVDGSAQYFNSAFRRKLKWE